MNADRLLALALLASLAGHGVACGGRTSAAKSTAAPAAPAPTASVTASSLPAPTASSGAAAAASAAPATKAAPEGGIPCGNLGCLAFPTPEAAFEHVLSSKPTVVAIGEAHAQKGSEGVASTTERFTEQLLPLLRGRARELVIELLIASGRCGASEKKVAEKTARPVTESQAGGNQNEFLKLGERAKALGIRPQALIPTCEEYSAIASAGSSDVERLLVTVADASRRTLLAALDRPGASAEGGIVLAYGGALHNDIHPRAGRERWSFGPALSERLGSRYVELDLIVREYVKDTDSWRAFPWYAEVRTRPSSKETLLYSPSPGSFVLVFPGSSP